MDSEEIEEHLQQRARHHDAQLVVGEHGDTWRAAFEREDGDAVLEAIERDREHALRALYEEDELEDLRGG
jgi:hypothetical protein